MKKAMKPLLPVYFFLFSASALAHTGYPDTVNCPIDGKQFVVYVTMSYTSFGTLRDFQKQGAIGYLYEHSISSCPSCHYSGYHKDIDTTFDEKTKADIRRILEPYQQDTMTDVRENEIAIQINLYFNRKNDEIAYLYLVASYFLRNDTILKSKRIELQRNCIKYLLKAIEAKEYDEKETYASTWYLVGELYRRTGDFDEAIKYFDMALNAKEKAKWLPAIAKEQRAMAKKKDADNSI